MFRTVLVTIYLHYLFYYNYNNPICKNFYCHNFTEKTNKLKFQAGHKPSVLIPKLKLLTITYLQSLSQSFESTCPFRFTNYLPDFSIYFLIC